MPFALAGLALAWAVMLLFGGLEFDRGLLMLTYAGDYPQLVAAARAVTWLGDFRVLIPAALLGALWLVWRRDWRDAILLLALPLSGRLLVTLQKDLVDRLRPDAAEHLVTVTNASFPSGHAANATMTWLALALILPRTDRARFAAVWAAVWVALLVGLTRPMLGVHWPSDVIGGWSFGLAWTLLLLRMAGHTTEDGTTEPPGYGYR